MKKILAIAMALVMMMSVMVPVFAGELTQETGKQSGEAIVKVDGIDDMGEGSYTVSIPASIDLIWGNNGEDQYTIVHSQVQTGKRVKVSILKTKDLTNKTDANETIEFSVADRTDGLASAAVVSVAETHKFDITIAENEWKEASIADYEGIITFTSEIVDA